MKGLFLFICSAVINLSAYAQIQHGSVGVIYYTKDKIIVAADSRGLVLNGNTPPDDTECKIAAPDGKMVFVSTQSTEYKNGGYADPVPSWSNVGEIRKAYGKASLLYSTNRDRIEGTAVEWGKLISSHFQTLLLWHPEKTMEAVNGGNGVLTRSIIGGLDNDGLLMLLRITIAFHEGIFAADTVQIPSCDACSKPYWAIGQVEVEQEFVDLTSQRARSEVKTWRPPKESNLADYDILRTMRLVELTIQYHKGNDVGGKIDAVEMDKDGSMRWFAIKENCAKD
jgi:hypothetical protein